MVTHAGYAGLGANELTVWATDGISLPDLARVSVKVSGNFDPVSGRLTPEVDCALASPSVFSPIACTAGIVALSSSLDNSTTPASRRAWNVEHQGDGFAPWSIVPLADTLHFFTALTGFGFDGITQNGAFSAIGAGMLDQGREFGYQPPDQVTYGVCLGELRDSANSLQNTMTSYGNTVGVR